MELFIRENHKVWPKVVLFGITVQQLINLQARLFYAILLSRGLLQINILLLIFKDHINQSKFYHSVMNKTTEKDLRKACPILFNGKNGKSVDLRGVSCSRRGSWSNQAASGSFTVKLLLAR